MTPEEFNTLPWGDAYIVALNPRISTAIPQSAPPAVACVLEMDVSWGMGDLYRVQFFDVRQLSFDCSFAEIDEIVVESCGACRSSDGRLDVRFSFHNGEGNHMFLNVAWVEVHRIGMVTQDVYYLLDKIHSLLSDIQDEKLIERFRKLFEDEEGLHFEHGYFA